MEICWINWVILFYLMKNVLDNFIYKVVIDPTWIVFL